jgi:UDP-N-acetylmuramate dehydrogenase
MTDPIFEKFKTVVPHIQRNVLLKNHTTFNIGGPAKYFLIAEKKEDIKNVLQVATQMKVSSFILGGGSNMLASDKGFDGLVIKIENKEPIILTAGNMITAPAGVTLGSIVDFSIENSLQGLEWAGGLPGTFGGAIRGNAGAFGGEMKDSIFEVQALDRNLKLKKLSNKQCAFSYRSSLFKQKNWIVLSASVKLKKGDKKKLREMSDSHIAYRKEKHPLEYPNAGSIFKNVDVKDLLPQWQKFFAEKIKQDPFPIIPSAWFIIGVGLTGKKIGKAQVSQKHSNYIINTSGAKAQDVVKLIAFIQSKVKKKYGIILEQEVQFLGSASLD